MNFDDLKHLAVTLPEDIMKEKWSGNFDRAKKLIERRLEREELSHAMRCRLEYELAQLARFEHRYTLTREELLAQIRAEIPDFSEEEFEELQLDNKVDWIYINGQVRFLGNALKTLKQVYTDFRVRTGDVDFGGDNDMNEFIDEAEDGKEYGAHIHIRHEIHLKEESVDEGQTLHIHLPVPCERDQIKNLKIINVEPKPLKMPTIDEPHPCAYIETKPIAGKVCSCEYEFDSWITYRDWEKVDCSLIKDEDVPEEVASMYTGENLPHIIFTHYIKEMAKEIVGDEKNMFLKARKIYEYITKNIHYRFLREYANIDCIPEYCLTNMRGDCGMMALTFICLCRASGIPARWQSGLDSRPEEIGEHDWAEYYIPSLGWLRCDLSRASNAWRRGDEKRWNFYFCNVDPFRVPLNNEFQKPFTPPKKFSRMDPYDNQTGELEYDNRGLYEPDRSRKYFDMGIHLIK